MKTLRILLLSAIVSSLASCAGFDWESTALHAGAAAANAAAPIILDGINTATKPSAKNPVNVQP